MRGDENEEKGDRGGNSSNLIDCYDQSGLFPPQYGVIAPLEQITGIMNAYDIVNFKESFIITARGIETTRQACSRLLHHSSRGC